MDNNIYHDIAQRTQGNVYVGIVGPVRTGKSTFIKKFMETLVLPNIENDAYRERALDELPQSAAGKTIMTTEPKFIPEEAVTIAVDGNASINVRLIDCVGYIVPSSLGYIEDEMPRMVITPWFEEEIPFNMAAEVGTKKVITEHSTVGILVTTDGSISDIPRAEYQEAEQRVVSELKSYQKPFVMVMNCVDPHHPDSVRLCRVLSEEYDVPVIPINCLQLAEIDIKAILKLILFQFPIKEIAFSMPKWVNSLAKNHWLKDAIFSNIKESVIEIQTINQIEQVLSGILQCPYVVHAGLDHVDLGVGSANLDIRIQEELFYQVISEQTGLQVKDESEMMPLLTSLAAMKIEYDKFQGALEEVEATGYGIVMPTLDQLSLQEPEIVKHGGRYGVRLRATAPSIHLVKASIHTEVSPIVGTESQSEDLVMYLLKEFDENPQKIWESNIFGKTLHSLVNEGLHNKLYRMPPDARMKLKETIERMINDGCSGLICIIL